MNDLFDELKILLQQDARLAANGELLKNQVTELTLKMDRDLLKLLLSSERLKAHFFADVDGIIVFDKEKFLRFVNNKAFLPDSYTTFKNKIGLTTLDGHFLSDSPEVVLSWPYKDCVLEGGQTKEDAKRDEVFWNEILAPDQVDRLLAPKVLTNFRQYDADGEHPVTGFTGTDNFIIKGNNLLALHSLKKCLQGKIDVIYIDPPYNPKSRSNTFCYNNTFNHSTWLTFMKNRLEAAKQLLAPDGALIVAIDDNEQAYLGVMLRELFRKHEIHCITIVHNPRGVQGTNFSYTHEYAFFALPAGKKSVGNRSIAADDVVWSNLRNWGGESLREDARNCFYPVIVRAGEIFAFGDVLPDDQHPEKQTVVHGTECHGTESYVYPIDSDGIERKWRYARQSVEGVKHLLRAKKTEAGYEIEIGKDFGTYRTVWVDTRYDANQYGTQIVRSLVPSCAFDFPKSLYNVYDCLHAVVAGKKDAVVLDFFAGSGTTAHALLELNKKDAGNRRFILCEQMDYVETVTVERVRRVIEKHGAGSFVFLKLMEHNEIYAHKILRARRSQELLRTCQEMQTTAHLSYRLDLRQFDPNAQAFADLNLEDQKRFLMEVLDKNALYVNLSEMDDETYAVSEEDKRLNRLFYGL
jgi:adenine-specific DNA-methyltransferase